MPFPIEEKYIKETEEKIGKIFPQWFRVKMMSENGGQAPAAGDYWDLYPFWNKANKKVMTRTADDIIRNTASAREYFGFPSDAIAFAHNGTGSFLVFIPENEVYLSSNVYLWDHETGELEGVRLQ